MLESNSQNSRFGQISQTSRAAEAAAAFSASLLLSENENCQLSLCHQILTIGAT